MIIDQNTVRKIAHLARLEFEPEAEQQMIDDLNKILDWIEKLREVDTDHVAPLTHMSEEVNVLREDRAAPPLERERGLRNAPARDSDYVRVPKVLDA